MKKEIMTLKEAIKKYDGQWIAFKDYEKGENRRGEVILHTNDRENFDSLLLQISEELEENVSLTIKYCWDDTNPNHPLYNQILLLLAKRG